MVIAAEHVSGCDNILVISEIALSIGIKSILTNAAYICAQLKNSSLLQPTGRDFAST